MKTLNSKQKIYVCVFIFFVIFLSVKGVNYFGRGPVIKTILTNNTTTKNAPADNGLPDGPKQSNFTLGSPQKEKVGTTITRNDKMTPADWHVVAQWQETIGWSADRPKLYESYDFDTLMKLAQQGDIFALQQVVFTEYLPSIDNNSALKNQLLFDAAARGSSKALIMTGGSIGVARSSFLEGRLTEEKMRERYRLSDSGLITQDALHILIAANYVVAGMRGDVNRADFSLKRFQKHTIKRDFTKKEWQQIIANSAHLYQSLSDRREQFGLDGFDNSYPAEYARFWGYPSENTVFSDLIKYVKTM